MANAESITNTRLMIVEGEDEKCLVERLLRDLHCLAQTWAFMGKNAMVGSFNTFIKTPGFDEVLRLGIVRDADNSHASAFQSLQGMITRAGFTPPKSAGTFTTDQPSIGIFLMPDNNSKGMLEDLFLESVSKEPGFQCVEDFEKCINELDPRPRNISKAKSLAYLATCEEACPNVGWAAGKGYWDLSAPCMDPLKEFLKDFGS